LGSILALSGRVQDSLRLYSSMPLQQQQGVAANIQAIQSGKMEALQLFHELAA
jgi:hypothetical protein